MSDVTPIEIALDLETTLLYESSHFAFSGPAEPRICLVAAFALTSQLKRIIAAVDRAVPARAPSDLRVVPAPMRSANAAPRSFSIEPMVALRKLQTRLIRATEPGLLHSWDGSLSDGLRNMGAEAERFVRDFVPSKALPVLEPAQARASEALDLRAVGITIYRLGNRGAPESILAHWPYIKDSRGKPHLKSGP